MQASPLPPPLHLAPSLAFYPSLSWPERHAIGHAMLAIARRGGHNCGGDAAGKTACSIGCARTASPPAAIRRFWGVVLVSALNEELDRIDARYGLDVFWKAFLANRAGYRLGIPRVPLGELYDGCRAAIERQGGEVALRAPVRRVRIADGQVAAVEMDGGYEQTADFYLLAVPHDAVPSLLPAGAHRREPVFANLRNLRSSPITGVHFWFDRDVMSEPFLTLARPHHAVDFQQVSPLWRARRRPLPATGHQRLLRSRCRARARKSSTCVWRSCAKSCPRHATQTSSSPRSSRKPPRHSPRSQARIAGVRRSARRLPNLFLAGDWTATGWPATMEGAVRSGYLAAEAILAGAGAPKRLLQPDLPAEGFASWLAQPIP